MNDGDCNSGYCNAMMMCATPTCMDMAQNQDETDVDCGGATCPLCMNGQTCMGNGDCASTYCNGMMTCVAPTCTDTVKNGTESDVDCGGPTCGDCAIGQSCFGNNDCVSTYCNAMNKCAAATCNDGIQNGTETGVDCGGTCLKCTGGTCAANTECASGMCYAGTCVASVNGCNIATATDLTAGMTGIVTFANGNFTYAPKCIKMKASATTVVTFNGNFVSHNLTAGQVVAGVGTQQMSGPFFPSTTTGTTANFTMDTAGTFPYYCLQHQGLNMSGVVFVVP
jgi:plastocyanin